MTRRVLLSLSIGLSIAGMVDGFAAQQQLNTATILRELAKQPEPSFVVPRNLSELIRISQAAVVGRIVGHGDLVSLDDVGTRGQLIGVDVFASYEVSISEVLFNRKAEGPSLTPGQVTTLTQAVGSREATDFVARNVPGVGEDEYLLFLWLRPGSTSWSMLRWPLQFRKSSSVVGGAETVLPLPDRTHFTTTEWLGPAVRLATQGRDKAVGRWQDLISEVRRVSSAQQPR